MAEVSTRYYASTEEGNLALVARFGEGFLEGRIV